MARLRSPIPTLSEDFPEVFSACAVTRAQSLKLGEIVNLSDSLLAPLFGGDNSVSVPELSEISNPPASTQPGAELLHLSISCSLLIKEQHADPTLVKCLFSVCSLDEAKEKGAAYFTDDEVLMRKWNSPLPETLQWNTIFQIVVPQL